MTQCDAVFIYLFIPSSQPRASVYKVFRRADYYKSSTDIPQRFPVDHMRGCNTLGESYFLEYGHVYHSGRLYSVGNALFLQLANFMYFVLDFKEIINKKWNHTMYNQTGDV